MYGHGMWLLYILLLTHLVLFHRNAWQSLGNMNPEVAMEQYVTLLSGSIPEWAGEKPRVRSIMFHYIFPQL